MVTFVGKQYKPALPLSPLKSPHTMTLLGCFTVLMMYLETFESLRTNLYPLRTSREVLSLQNITFLQSAIVQCLHILQNNILFFIMTLIIRGFLAVGDMAFSDPLQTLLDSPNRHFLDNLCMFFFNDAAVTEGYIHHLMSYKCISSRCGIFLGSSYHFSRWCSARWKSCCRPFWS